MNLNRESRLQSCEMIGQGRRAQSQGQAKCEGGRVRIGDRGPQCQGDANC